MVPITPLRLVPIQRYRHVISLEEQYVDGTKIESEANKYTFVWKKTVEKNSLRIISYLLIPAAFRSLSRPSSAPSAKAFTLRSF